MANNIHPTAIIDKRVELGNNNTIGPYSVIYGPTYIGDENEISPHVTIGTPGQDTRNPRYDSSESVVKIGSRNNIREFTSIQKPCYKDITEIGSDVFLMQSVHIPHDALIFDKVVITPMCVLAGITRILEGANVGMGASVNQYCVVGQYSIVATGAAAMKNIKPFSRYIPNKPLTVNTYAVKKFGFERFEDEITAYILQNEAPSSNTIVEIVDTFNQFHEESGRDMYT